ncbi:MAG: hypothetical protein WBA83_14475 [Burkholderiaceae bacterium]
MRRLFVQLPALVWLAWLLGMGAPVSVAASCAGDKAGVAEGKGAQCLDGMLPPGVSPLWRLRFPEAPDALGPRIQVTGVVKDQHFSPSSIETVPTGIAVDPAIPLGSSLLGALSPHGFGSEERARIVQDSNQGYTVHCSAGQAPAGVLWRPDSGRLPAGARAELRIRARGDSGFQWGVAAPGKDAVLLRPVAASGPTGLEAAIPLDAVSAALGGEHASFVLMCPARAASLTIQSIELRPLQAVGEGLRAAWNWTAEHWRADPAALIARAEALGLRRLYVALDVEPSGEKVVGADLLAAFVAMASSRGMAVWAVEGDPGMATPQGREQALRRLRALHAYQADVEPSARLGGVQYDIEPYLLPAYRTDPRAVAQEWARTIQALNRHSTLKLDMVLPFWLPQSPMGDTVLGALRKTKGSLTIMAYRVDPLAIQRVAEPLLAWGAAAGIPVYVALEAGPLDDELTQFYTEAPAGLPASLWLTTNEEGGTAVLLPKPVLLSQGKGYNASGQQPAPASLVSFKGNHQAMLAASRQLQPVLRAWPSYAGMAYHGLLD